MGRRGGQESEPTVLNGGSHGKRRGKSLPQEDIVDAMRVDPNSAVAGLNGTEPHGKVRSALKWLADPAQRVADPTSLIARSSNGFHTSASEELNAVIERYSDGSPPHLTGESDSGPENKGPQKLPSRGLIFPKEMPPMTESMMDRENTANVELIGDAVEYWFGRNWRVLAYHANPHSTTFLERETDKKVYSLDRAIKKGLPDTELNQAEQIYDRDHAVHNQRDLLRARRSVNRHMFQRIQQNFQPGNSPKDYLEDMWDFANDAHTDVTSTLFPDFPGITAQLNEVGLQLRSPAAIVEYMARDDVHEDLKYEIQKALVRTYIAATIESRDRLERTRERMQNFEELLDSDVFDGQTGETTQVWVTSFHEKQTKAVTYINNVDGPPKQRIAGSMQMNTPLRLRALQDFDFKVYTNPRRKKMSAGVIKGIRKPIKERLDEDGDAVLNPTLDVRDTRGIKFAVQAGSEEAKFFTDYLNLLLISDSSQSTLALRGESDEPLFEEPEYDEQGLPILDADGDPTVTETILDFHNNEIVVTRKKYKGRVIKIVDDSKPNESNDNSNGIDFYRMQVYFSDSEVPLEIMVQDLRGFLESEYEVGHEKRVKVITKRPGGVKIERTRTRFTGRGHGLYVKDRARDVRRKFVDESSHGQLIDLDREEEREYRKSGQRARKQQLGRVR